MSLVDALLAFAAALTTFALMILLILRPVRRMIFWLGGSAWVGGWLNVMIWRADQWSPTAGLTCLLAGLLIVGSMVLRDMLYDWRMRQGWEWRRARYRDYPFNQWKPDDVDTPIDV